MSQEETKEIINSEDNIEKVPIKKKPRKPRKTKEKVETRDIVPEQIDNKVSGNYKSTELILKDFSKKFNFEVNKELLDFMWQHTKHLDYGVDSFITLCLYNSARVYDFNEVIKYDKFLEDVNNGISKLKEQEVTLGKDIILWILTTEYEAMETETQKVELVYLASKCLDLCIPF